MAAKKQAEDNLDKTATETPPKDGDVTEAPRRTKKVLEADCHMTEAVQNSWTIFPAADTTREDVLEPVYWAHFAHRMRPLDRITVVPKGAPWYGEYIVQWASENEAHLKEKYWESWDRVRPKDLANKEYEVKFDPVQQFHVVRKSDGEVVHANEPTKDLAAAWMFQHSNAMAA